MNTTLVTDEMLQTYRRDGVVKVPQIITPDEASRFRKIAMDLLEAMPRNPDRPFNQKVNVWRDDPVLKTLTQHPNVAAVAEKLAESTTANLARSHSGEDAGIGCADRVSSGPGKVAL